MEVWFIEVKNIFGVWSSRLVHGSKPDGKKVEGNDDKYRTDPVLVPKCLRSFSLQIIECFLGVDGALREYDPEIIVKLLRGPEKEIHITKRE